MSQIISPQFITQGKRKLRLRVETYASGEQKTSVVDLETDEALTGVKSINLGWSNRGVPTALIELEVEDIEVSVLSAKVEEEK
jgi:hypothetical protein